ncbi:penicillin-binding protein 2 [Gemmatimonadota bacterium]
MTGDDAQGKRWRASLLFGGYGLVLLFLFLRVGHLQIARHDAMAALSDQNRLRPTVQQPVRGRIYDRDGLLIVDNRISWTVTVSPQDFRDNESVITDVADILGIPVSRIEERLQQRKGHLYTPVPIARDVSFEVVARLSERRPDLPGVSIQMEPRRRYPFGMSAAHILGYLREIDDIDLAARQSRGEDYIFGDLVGKEGLERSHEADLRGSKGVNYLEVDARGRTIGPAADRSGKSAIQGSDLIATLDIQLQQTAEAAFHDTARGAVVVMDPRDGALLVLASVPSFDLRDFSGVLEAAMWDSLNNDERMPLINRPIAGLYPPASPFKAVTTLAGFEQGVIDLTTTFDPCVPGGWRLGNRSFQCWNEIHGSLSVVEAIEQSCDVFFYQVGVETGLRPLSRMARAFGLGEVTGLNIPGEVAGSFPDAAYYDRTIGQGQWVEEGQVINLAIGQGEILVTPLQMACLTAAIANGGALVTPYLVAFTEQPANGDRTAISQTPPRIIGALDPDVLDIVREGMVRVVHGENGTAKNVAWRAPGINVAGKTGTGQNPHGENHAWFTCFAPADDPQIVVTVLVENGGGGSAVAAPIAAAILKAWFDTHPQSVQDVGGSRRLP